MSERTPTQERLHHAIEAAAAIGADLGNHHVRTLTTQKVHLADTGWGTPITTCRSGDERPGNRTTRQSIKALAENPDTCPECFTGRAIDAKDADREEANPLTMWTAHLTLTQHAKEIKALHASSTTAWQDVHHYDQDIQWLTAGLEHWKRDQRGNFHSWKGLALHIQEALRDHRALAAQAAQAQGVRDALAQHYQGHRPRKQSLVKLATAPHVLIIWSGNRREMRDRIHGADSTALLAWDRTEPGHGCHLSITPGPVAAGLVKNGHHHVLAIATLNSEIDDKTLETAIRLWEEAEAPSILEELQVAVDTATAVI